MSEADGSNLHSRAASSEGSSDGDHVEIPETPYSFTASTVTAVDAAGIRVLVVPIGAVRQQKLAEWSSGIAQFTRVELSDLLAHVDPELVAAGYSGGTGGGIGGAEGGVEGALHLVYTSDHSADHEYLEGLQTYRQILGVIGIVDCKLSPDVSEAYSEFLGVLAEFPTAVGYRCLAFDPQASQEDDVAGVTVIPNYGSGERGRLLFYLQTVVSDFGGSMVSALSMMASSIEDRADLLPTPPAASPARRSASTASASASASDHGDDAADGSSGSPAHPAAAAAAGRRESTHSLALGRGRRGGELDRDGVGSGAPGSPAFERRGAAGGGRLKKLQGDLFLMSGRLGEAFSAYAAAIEASRRVGDHLWHAVALEAYCAALLLLCARAGERRLAAAYMAAVGEGGAGGLSPPTADLGGVLAQLGRLYAQVPAVYERCYAFAPLLHSEACVRAALVLCATREALLDDAEAAVRMLVHVRQPAAGSAAGKAAAGGGGVVRDVVAAVRNVPLRAAVSEWLQRAWAGGAADALALADRLEMTAEASAVFRRVGYSRKAFFFLRQFLLLAIPVLLRTAAAGSPGGRPSTSARTTDHTALSAFADGASAFAAVSAAAAAAAAAAVAAGAPGGGALDGAVLARAWDSRPRAGLHAAVVGCLDALVGSFGRGLAATAGGWQQLQADVLRECLAIAEALPSYAHALAAAFRLVRCLGQLAAEARGEPGRRALADEQMVLRAYVVRTVALFHRQRRQRQQRRRQHVAEDGEDGGAARACRVAGRDAAVLGGAADALLVGVQLCAPAAPVAAAAADADAGAAAGDALFLHNPSAQAQAQEAPVLVAGEAAHVVATLANPFPFALPLSGVALVAETPGGGGVASAEVASVVLPAGARAHVRLTLTPAAAGQLRIRGVRLALFQHLQAACLLADEDAAGLQRRMREQPMRRRLSAERKRLMGQDREASACGSPRLSAMNAGHVLLARVAPEMPRLAVSESSLACEESLSVYEGEARVVELTLVNVGRAAAARLHVSFAPAGRSADDAGARDLVSAAFSSRPPQPLPLPAGGQVRLSVRVRGLAGLAGGHVVVRYAGAAGPMWERELRWPLRVSVERLVAPAHAAMTGAAVASDLRTRITPLPTYIARAVAADTPPAAPASSGALVDVLRDAYAKAGRGGAPQEMFCLAEVNLVNMGASDVEVRVEVDLAEAPSEQAGRAALVRVLKAVLPGRRSVTRVVVPLRRVRLGSRRLAMPVPGAEADGGADRSAFYAWHRGLTPDGANDDHAWVAGEDAAGGHAAADAREPGRRQFVVSRAAGMAAGELAGFRRAHWYQAETAARVRLAWRCAQSGRQGFIDPRPLLALDARGLAFVRPGELRVLVRVGGREAVRVDAGLVRARCAVAGEEDTAAVGISLENQGDRSLALVLAAMPGDPEDAPLSQYARAAVPAEAREDGALALVPYAAAGRVAEASHGALAFRSLEPSGAPRDPQPADPAPPPPPLACLDGLVFDSIAALDLPTIAPGATHELTLPVCVLSPGIHRLHFTIAERTPSDQQHPPVTLHETLMIEAS